MTEDDGAAEDAAPDRPGEFDWRSPRWREGDQVQRDVERGRRFRGDRAPQQPGAIDQGRSVDRSAGTPGTARDGVGDPTRRGEAP